MRISGPQRDVERGAKFIGYPIRPSNASDVTLIGMGIFFGALVGLVSIRVGEIPVSLSTSGGTLLAGLIFGWLRSLHPGVLLGACADVRASTVALSVIQDAAQRRVPTLGFTVCFAVAITLLTICGLVIVLLLQ